MGNAIDSTLAGIAERQHGVLAVEQLLAAGLTHQAVRARVRSGRLHRLHRGVYAVGHRAHSFEQRAMAAALAAGEGAAVSHLSAARMWGIVRQGATGGHLHVTGRRRRRISGVQLHLTSRLGPRHIQRLNNIPVTSVARTLVDLADLLEPEPLANVMHEAAFRNLLDVRGVRRMVERMCGRRRLWVVERALQLHLSGSAGTRSRLEQRFLELVRSAGLPDPEINIHVETGSGTFEIDMLWRRGGTGLCVEIDGPGHRRPRTTRQDRRRDRALRAAGYDVVRVTAAQVRAGAGGPLSRIRLLL